MHTLTSIAHHFLSVDTSLTNSNLAVFPCLLSSAPSGANSLDAAFSTIAIHEQELLHVLLGAVERDVRVVGDEMARVPTVSFVVTGRRAIKSKELVKVFDAKGGVSYYVPFL